MNIKNTISKNSFVIVTHEYATGPSHSLEVFLKGKAKSLLFIGHPFVFAKDIRSHLRQYGQKGELLEEKYFHPFVKSQIISVFKDLLLTFFWVKKRGPFDIYIGVDNINVLVGLLLKKFGFVNKIVFYTIDYVPLRFNNNFLNSIYHYLDKLAVAKSDIVWNLSKIMVQEREKKGFSNIFRKKQIVVPVGTERVQSVNFTDVKRFHLAHMGHLTQKQGVQTIISATPQIIEKLPDFHLDIIGGGEYETELIKLCKLLNMDKYISFYGFIKDHRQVEKKLSQCAAAIAPYVDSPANFVRYSDPGKVKAYLAAGLPIIITMVPDVWRELLRKKCGVAVNDSVSEISQAVVWLLSDGKRLKVYRQNAKLLAEKYYWDRVFEKAWDDTLKKF